MWQVMVDGVMVDGWAKDVFSDQIMSEAKLGRWGPYV